MKPTPRTPPGMQSLHRASEAARLDAIVREGWRLQQAGEHEAARRQYEKVLAVQPRHGNALHMMGVLALQAGRHADALVFLDRAVKVERDQPQLWNNRGAAQAGLQRYDLAVANYDKAIAARPDFESAYNNRGVAWTHLAQYERALADFDRAIALRSNYAEAHFNRARALVGMRRDEHAVESYEAAIALRPDLPAFRWNLGMCLLRMGRFDRGWTEHEARLAYWQQRGHVMLPEAARWTGREALAGRTLRITHEQGLGDTLQFARLAPCLASQADAVWLEVQPALLGVLAPLPGVQVVASGAAPEPLDLHCALMSLPGLLGVGAEHIPAPTPIRVDAERAAVWGAWLGPRTRPRVGLAWRGNPVHVEDRHRSVPFAELAGLLDPHVEWLSLQRDIPADDRAALQSHPEVRRLDAEPHDLADVAALCTHLDLVITVDTALAHLAASMARPVWLMLGASPDWRWMRDRSDSPWYPSLTVHRQPHPGDWTGLVAALRERLAAHFAG